MFIDQPVLKAEAAQRDRLDKQRSDRDQKASIQHSAAAGQSQKSNRSSKLAAQMNYGNAQGANTINSSRSGQAPIDSASRKLSQNALQGK